MSHTDVGRRVLIARGVDGLLVGWLAVLVWIGGYVATRFGVGWGGTEFTIVFWAGAAVTAAHFGLSYHLAYRDGLSAVRSRPMALAFVPAVLFVVLAGLIVVSLGAGHTSTLGVTSALITSVYLMTTWHYVKQVYGVGRVAAAYAGVRLGTWDVRVLRYGLYPLSFVGAAKVLSSGSAYYLAGYPFGFSVLPLGAFRALQVLAICAAVPVLAVFVRIAVRRRKQPPSLMLAPYVATFLWLGLPTNPLLTLLLLAPFHGLQYLAIGHRAEVAISPTTRHSIVWWLNIFVGAAAGGLLVSRWLPQWLDAHLPVTGSGGPALFAACFFVFLNMHHYAIDATIWRSKGELVKALVRKPAAPAAQPAQTMVTLTTSPGRI